MISHHWPGLTPFNVWDLDVATWCLYARAADNLIKSREQAARTRGRG